MRVLCISPCQCFRFFHLDVECKGEKRSDIYYRDSLVINVYEIPAADMNQPYSEIQTLPNSIKTCDVRSVKWVLLGVNEMIKHDIYSGYALDADRFYMHFDISW